ncbi:PQQ-dependent sugar dehydrogenase [Aliikangiella maris]|uniref:PQQ-dependent sugar dehydrogenase n=2 Tax=Aliikangiella maris TaxID=3162458 RepID=A0ABV2BTI4_9GAMM
MKFFKIMTLLIIAINGGIAFEGRTLSIGETIERNGYKLMLIAKDIEIPWGLTQLPNGDFIATSRPGKLFYITSDKLLKHQISGLPPVHDFGQGGLLDIQLHPNFKDNGWIYFSYSHPDEKRTLSNTAIMRAKLKDKKQLIDVQQIYVAQPYTSKRQHFGSRMVFDSDGYLYFSIGDRGDRKTNPQSIQLDAGKIYRIHDDGKIPTDNPFVKIPDAKPAIYSYGHRNPQGMALHPQTSQVWVHEHGPKGGDEINIIEGGKNYGWPIVSYGVNYDGSQFTELTEKKGMEQPVWYWDPSIAPSGMTFVVGDYYPKWKGHLIVGSLKFGKVILCQLKGNKVVAQKTILSDLIRVRNVTQLNDGYIYLATDEGNIYRVLPE